MSLNGFSEWDAWMVGMIKDLDDGVQEVTEKNLYELESKAKHDVPVDTGNLRGSIITDARKYQGDVSSSVEYSEHVEFGTYKMSARPYLFNNHRIQGDKYLKDLDDLVKKVGE